MYLETTEEIWEERNIENTQDYQRQIIKQNGEWLKNDS